MITFNWLNEAKLTNLISKKGDSKKCHVKFVFWKVFSESICCNVADFFLLVEHSKGNWALQRHSKGILRALGHWGTQREKIGHPKGIPRAHQGHTGTQDTCALGHSGTWVLGHSKGTWALKNSGTWSLRHSRHLRYFI